MQKRSGMGREEVAAGNGLREGWLARVADAPAKPESARIRTPQRACAWHVCGNVQESAGTTGQRIAGCGRAGSPAWLPAGAESAHHRALYRASARGVRGNGPAAGWGCWRRIPRGPACPPGCRRECNPHRSAHPNARAREYNNGSATSPLRPRSDGPPAGVHGLPGAGQPVGRNGSGRCGGAHSGCRQRTRTGIGNQAVVLLAACAKQIRGFDRRRFVSWQVTSPKGRVTASKRVGRAAGIGKRLKLDEAMLIAPGAGSTQGARQSSEGSTCRRNQADARLVGTGPCERLPGGNLTDCTLL